MLSVFELTIRVVIKVMWGTRNDKIFYDLTRTMN